MAPVLIVGATRGLGAELVKLYAGQGVATHGTTRADSSPEGFPEGIKWLPKVDLMRPDVGDTIVRTLGPSIPLGTVVCLLQLAPSQTPIEVYVFKYIYIYREKRRG